MGKSHRENLRETHREAGEIRVSGAFKHCYAGNLLEDG